MTENESEMKWNMMLKEKCRIRYNFQWRPWLECWFLNSHMHAWWGVHNLKFMESFFNVKSPARCRRYVDCSWSDYTGDYEIGSQHEILKLSLNMHTRFPFVSTYTNVIIECFPICFSVYNNIVIVLFISYDCSFAIFTAWS